MEERSPRTDLGVCVAERRRVTGVRSALIGRDAKLTTRNSSPSLGIINLAKLARESRHPITFLLVSSPMDAKRRPSLGPGGPGTTGLLPSHGRDRSNEGMVGQSGSRPPFFR